MINSGRIRKTSANKSPAHTHTYGAMFTAIIGTLVFAVFTCTSINNQNNSANVSTAFGEGACQAAAYSDSITDTKTYAEKDESIWGYFETVIERLLRGET